MLKKNIHVCVSVYRWSWWWRTHLPMQETEDPLENGLATHSSSLDLENPMDRGAWWATVHGVTQSQTRLKQLSTNITESLCCTAELTPCKSATTEVFKTLYSSGNLSVLWSPKWEGNPKTGICMWIADSLCCIVETNTALQGNYTPTQINFKNNLKLINNHF